MKCEMCKENEVYKEVIIAKGIIFKLVGIESYSLKLCKSCYEQLPMLMRTVL